MQQWWISAWWDCDVWRKVDFIQQPATTSSVVRLSAPKHFPKPNLYQKKITVTVWWLVASYPLWLCESWWNHYMWEVCSANQWDASKTAMPTLKLVNRMGPIFIHNNAQPHITQWSLQKLNELGCEVLPHLPYSPDFSPPDYHFFKHLYNFLQRKCFHNQQEAENAF